MFDRIQKSQILGNLGVLVKPGIILPSERHADICHATNDGYQQTNGGSTGNGVWWERACEGLSVFWIANIQNFVHDNASVGGYGGIWVFTHSSNPQYGWQSIPVDPVTGKREWRNNKVSFGAENRTKIQLNSRFLLPSMDSPWTRL